MTVIDASAVVLGLLNDGAARAALSEGAITCPHLVDSEVVQALRSQVFRGEVDLIDAQRALRAWQGLGVERISVVGLVGRIWELRENVSAYDATYVALAEALSMPLVTADGRLGRAPGPRCTVTVVRG